VAESKARVTAAVAAGDRWAGDDGTTYPVELGQTWKVGPHLFVASDFMNSDELDKAIDRVDAPPTLVYSDPPWGQGLVNSFRTKAGLPHAAYRWEELYRRIADLGQSRGLPVFLEGSVILSRDGSKILSTMKHRSKQVNHYWPIEYANHAAAGLYYASDRPYPPELDAVLPGAHDRHTPAMVMAAYGPTGVVIEPCCGLGGTPYNAHLSGWGSINSELNVYRMSSALARLAKATGQEPERLS
jgi:hypothetical protein